MIIKNIVPSFVVLLAIFQESDEFKFMRRIEAVGSPYYKILMYLGHCKGDILYSDQKIWGKVPMNRVLDIYFKSGEGSYRVSRVEIHLIINSTNTIAFSEAGVGSNEFFATLYLPLNIGFIIYQLTIYTCSPMQPSYSTGTEKQDTDKYLPFITAKT